MPRAWICQPESRHYLGSPLVETLYALHGRDVRYLSSTTPVLGPLVWKLRDFSQQSAILAISTPRASNSLSSARGFWEEHARVRNTPTQSPFRLDLITWTGRAVVFWRG